MKFADFVCFEASIPKLQASTRDGVIEELVLSLEKCGKLGKGNCNKIVRAIVKRENEASTGMGKGVAVPHVKYKKIQDVVAVVARIGQLEHLVAYIDHLVGQHTAHITVKIRRDILGIFQQFRYGAEDLFHRFDVLLGRRDVLVVLIKT